MENAVIANNVWDMVKNLDTDIQFDIWKRLSKIFSKQKSKAEVVTDKEVKSEEKKDLTDEEKLEIFQSLKGSWDWPEEEYPTDQLIADIKQGCNWEEHTARLMKLFEENEDVFIGH